MRYNPSKAHPETYNLQDGGEIISSADAPFDTVLQIPLDATRGIPFFQTQYWGGHSFGDEHSWRRIDEFYLDQATDLALQLNSATNNTSLVLAIERENGDVLLFVADAQVGNWLSWQDLGWNIDGNEVTASDLLKRTIVYKTGHHGSHNATLKEKGLELMDALQWALIPVDHGMALKKRWGKMPLENIVKALNAKTKNRVLRVDEPVPAHIADTVNQGPEGLYYEIMV
jgi:hypothetical protein